MDYSLWWCAMRRWRQRHGDIKGRLRVNFKTYLSIVSVHCVGVAPAWLPERRGQRLARLASRLFIKENK
jgi:hypothetical protein